VLQNLLEGFAFILSFWSIIAAMVGVSAGIIVGAIPGLTATMAIAVLTPFTFFMSPTIGLPFLLGVYKGAIYGGSISAVLINTPGTAAAAATCIDGFALSQKGEARRGLEMSLYASVIGDLLSTFILIFASGLLASIALKFSSPEFTMLFLFSFTVIASVSGESVMKGLISTSLGILLACIGLDPLTGYQRFTFGSVGLQGGITLVPLLIGMFALSEVLVQSEPVGQKIVAAIKKGKEKGITLLDMKEVMPTILRSTGIGAFIGALPGIGAEVSCWIAYGAAKRRSKNPEAFGKGAIEGVAAAEAGNNAVCPAALIPMMAFGIPGDTVTAILLGAFMAQGLLPGPMLFVKHKEIIYGLFAILIISNVMMLGLGSLAIRYLRGISLVPQSILSPAVAVICFAGSFACNSSYFDLLITLVGGIFGYFMRKTGFPIAPLVIALLLSPGLESSLQQSLRFSDNNPMIFVTRPISALLFSFIIISLAFSAWKALRPKTAQPMVDETK
jgi:putative tricarboxylic transport membrane protein